MPTYDYKCQKCGHQFEFFQSMNDARLTDCPVENCDGQVKRLLGTGAGIIFKGSGFYETDYKRGDSYNKEAKADKGETPASTGSSDSGGSKSSESSTPSPAPSTPAKSTPAPSNSTKTTKSSD